MCKRFAVFVLGVLLLMNLCGCFVLLAGVAGGAGTAVWLSEKLTQEVDASLEKSVKAVKSALKSLNLEVTKETLEKDVAQIISKYTNGKTIWIDLRPITSARSKIEVRVGGIKGDKEAADKILKKILRYL